MDILDKLKGVNCSELLLHMLEHHEDGPQTISSTSVLDSEDLQSLLEDEKNMNSLIELAQKGHQDIQVLPRLLVIALSILLMPATSLQGND